MTNAPPLKFFFPGNSIHTILVTTFTTKLQRHLKYKAVCTVTKMWLQYLQKGNFNYSEKLNVSIQKFLLCIACYFYCCFWIKLCSYWLVQFFFYGVIICFFFPQGFCFWCSWWYCCTLMSEHVEQWEPD